MSRLLRAIQFTVDPLFATQDHSIRLSPSIREGQRRVQVIGSMKCANNVTRALAPAQTTVIYYFFKKETFTRISMQKFVLTN